MDKNLLQEEIAGKLAGTKVVRSMADELCRLLGEKPDGVGPNEYFHMVAIELLDQLRSQLLAHCRPGVLKETGRPVPEVDYDRILQGLLLVLEHDLVESNVHMIRALGSAIAERDTGTNEHNYRVTIYAVRIATGLDLPRDGMRSLIKGAFLHDIGKIGIPDAILVKPSGLGKEERELMNSHVRRGAGILEGVTWLEDALDVVRYHHERWDGSGYLNGLRGTDIPLNARIFAVGDVFDALTSRRPYKVPYTFREALTMIRDEAGKQFDPQVVATFLDIAEAVFHEISQSDCTEKEAAIRGFMREYFGFEVESGPLPTPCG